MALWSQAPYKVFGNVDGKMVTMYTLDQFSNGDMIYAKGNVDLVKGTMSFTAFPIQ